MTLHLAFINQTVVVHASDRLVTYNTIPGQHDVFANKTIVLAAHSGIVSIGYTGLSFVGDVPTDEWIAEVLWREPVGIGGTVVTGKRADKPRLDAGAYAELLRSSLEARFSELPTCDRHPLTLGLFGIHWPSDTGLLKPLNWTIENDPRDLSRFRGSRDRTLNGNPEGVVLRAVPPWPGVDLQRTAEAAVVTASVHEVNAALTGEMRRVAQTHPHIGADTLLVAITPGLHPNVTTYFNSAPHAPGLSDGEGVTPIAFSPWIVGRTTLIHPAAMGWSDITTTVDEYDVRITGSESQRHQFSFPHARKRRRVPGESPFEPMVSNLTQWLDLLHRPRDEPPV